MLQKGVAGGHCENVPVAGVEVFGLFGLVLLLCGLTGVPVPTFPPPVILVLLGMISQFLVYWLKYVPFEQLIRMSVLSMQSSVYSCHT